MSDYVGHANIINLPGNVAVGTLTIEQGFHLNIHVISCGHFNIPADSSITIGQPSQTQLQHIGFQAVEQNDDGAFVPAANLHLEFNHMADGSLEVTAVPHLFAD